MSAGFCKSKELAAKQLLMLSLGISFLFVVVSCSPRNNSRLPNPTSVKTNVMASSISSKQAYATHGCPAVITNDSLDNETADLMEIESQHRRMLNKIEQDSVPMTEIFATAQQLMLTGTYQDIENFLNDSSLRRNPSYAAIMLALYSNLVARATTEDERLRAAANYAGVIGFQSFVAGGVIKDITTAIAMVEELGSLLPEKPTTKEQLSAKASVSGQLLQLYERNGKPLEFLYDRYILFKKTCYAAPCDDARSCLDEVESVFFQYVVPNYCSTHLSRANYKCPDAMKRDIADYIKRTALAGDKRTYLEALAK